VNTITVFKTLDAASHRLIDASLEGQALDAVEIHVVSLMDSQVRPIASYRLSDVRILHTEHHFMMDESGMMETLELDFQRIVGKYYQTDNTGKVKGTIEFQWQR
jgi:type VI protein secretion system component Hcp